MDCKNNVTMIKADNDIRSRKIRQTNKAKLRVCAYCRVSTDTDEQAMSYQNQVEYYTDYIKKNKDKWDMVDIYADEAITGTMENKRPDFQRMIQDCKDGKIDMIITKSIARFARNTVDTLKNVRMLKDMQVAVFFESENIDTLTMNGELLLTVLASVAQQEVENTSANVKKGLKMKMSRGEIVGNSGCLGYNYDSDEKKLTVNEDEREVVKTIFKMYLEGYGAWTIKHYLEDNKIPTHRGDFLWSETGILYILKNPVYKGDLLQGKTFTVDPISKRRLNNFGEEDKYIAVDHHEAIITRDMWDAVQKLRIEKNYGGNKYSKGDKRTVYTNKYTFSSMIECGFCHANLSRRSWNCGTPSSKVIWQCVRATKNGKKFCPHSKGLPEKDIERAFVESFKMMQGNRDELINGVLEKAKKAMSEYDTSAQIKKRENDIMLMQKKIRKITDLFTDDSIENKQVFVEKYNELNAELQRLEAELDELKDIKKSESSLEIRINDLNDCLDNFDTDVFDPLVFKAIIDKVIVGGYDDDGTENPYLITFVYKTGFNAVADAKKICSSSKADTCRDYSRTISDNYVELLKFWLFSDHAVFTTTSNNEERKEISKGYLVMVVISKRSLENT